RFFLSYYGAPRALHSFPTRRSSDLPMKRPTQMALIVPFSDWRIEEASVGSAKASRVLAIGPSVRLPRPGRPDPASAMPSLSSRHCEPSEAIHNLGPAGLLRRSSSQ